MLMLKKKEKKKRRKCAGSTTALTLGCPTGGSTAGGLSRIVLRFTAWCINLSRLGPLQSLKGARRILARWSWSLPRGSSSKLHLGRLADLKSSVHMQNSASISPWLSDHEGIFWWATANRGTTHYMVRPLSFRMQTRAECCLRFQLHIYLIIYI